MSELKPTTKKPPKPKTADPADDPEFVRFAYESEGHPVPETVKVEDPPCQVWRGYQFGTPERQKAVLASCEKWLGTPHVNRIAVQGVGIDCVHFVHEVMKDSGVLPPADLGRYDLMMGLYEPSDHLKRTFQLACTCEELPIDDPKFGDIVIFKTGETSAHCGLYTPGHVWHSISKRAVLKSSWDHWKHKAECLIRITYPGFKVQPKKAVELCLGR